MKYIMKKYLKLRLSFSVPKKFKKVPPSLKNIYKEIKSNYPDFKIPNHGNLKNGLKMKEFYY